MSKAQCLSCKDVIESKHRHDFVQCKCRQKSDQIASEFRKILRGYEEEGIELSEHLACCAFEKAVGTGIFLDGGNDYIRSGGKLEHFKLIEGTEE